MITENPQVARLGSCLVGRLGNLVGIGQPFLDARVEHLGQFVLIEPQQAEVELHPLECRKLDRQQLEVPGGQVGGLVVGDAVRLDLGWRQVLGDVDGHGLEAELLRGLVAGVTADDHPLGVDDDRLAESELLDRRRHGIHRGVVLTRIARVGLDVRKLP